MTGTIVESCDQFRSVGKIRKAHGIRGELFLISFSKNFDWMGDVTEAQLVRKIANSEGELEDVRYNFEIKKAKDHKVGQILKLEGINDRNKAEEFEGAIFQVPQSIFKNESGDDFYLLQLKGFQVLDTNDNVKGEVIGFANNTAQDLLIVKNDEAEFEIPYVDQLIKKLDFTERKIVMVFPEGIEDNKNK